MGQHERPTTPIKLERPPDDFYFNALRTGAELFKEFKMHVIKKSRTNASINLECIQAIAKTQNISKKYTTPAWEAVDMKLMETNLVKDVLD